MDKEGVPVGIGNERAPRRLRVLVVEDDGATARTWLRLLGSLGHEVEAASDGPSALRAAKARPPDVILLDLGLPGISGHEVARRLREQPQDSRPLVIAITGFGEEEDRVHSYEVGIDLHLVKPVAVEELKTFLDRFQAVRKPPPPRAAEGGPGPPGRLAR
jgi:CheY-like chemotaxis protein